MSKLQVTRERVLSGTCNANIHFDDLCHLLERLGFAKRTTKSSHLIFSKPGVSDIVNLQPGRDGKAKPYQVKQVRALIIKIDPPQ